MNYSGLELAHLFFQEVQPLLLHSLPQEVTTSWAVGLAGEGSECFGFDDALSQDHDWGPAFCIWLPLEIAKAHVTTVQQALRALPAEFYGYPTRFSRPTELGRVGLISIEKFYRQFLNTTKAPTTWQEWRLIPEHYLATCTNGLVFYDALGTFSAIRNTLLQFYPEDVRRKKIAARLAGAAQSGQYNLLRMLDRNETSTAVLCAARFAEQVISLMFLLNKRYMPFYKWAAKSASTLPLLRQCPHYLEQLLTMPFAQGAAIRQNVFEITEAICSDIVAELHTQQLSAQHDTWLMPHATDVQNSIVTPELHAMPLQLE